MLFKSSTAVAILAAASQVVAEPTPYKALKVMSIRSIFGLAGRDSCGYSPTQSSCGLGDTCAEACGGGFDTCASTDNAIHCYDSTAQACCPDDSGNSCDIGYYCAVATNADTICCPDGQTLAECATSYGVTGGLVSEIAAATSTSSSASSTSTSSVVTTTSSSSSPSVSSTSSSLSSVSSTSSSSSSSFSAASASPAYSGNSTTIVKATGYTTTSCSATSEYTAGFGATNATYTSAQVTTSASASTSTTAVPVSGGHATQPVAAMAALVALAYAMMML